MKGIISAFLLFFRITIIYAQADPRLKGIEIQINKILNATHTPGCSIAIVEGEKIIYTGGLGYRDYENKIKVDTFTLFPIGSATKAFTAALLGQLQEQGLLDFEESPLKYVPALRFYNAELNEHVMVQDLLSMCTGLALHDKAWSGDPLNDRDSLLRRIKYLEPSDRLRATWKYSNFSYFILGTIDEKITGKTWEENIDQDLLRPLQMRSSNLGLKGLQGSSNVSLGYQVSDNKIEKVGYRDLGAMNPAGGINSNGPDMANWLLTWINKGKFNGKQILPEPYVMEATTGHAVMPKGYLAEEEYANMYLAAYGYGWIISDYKGHYRVEHGGSIDGFRTTVALFPNERIGIAVLTNQAGYEAALMIRNMIADKMLKESKTDWLGKYLKDQKEGQALSKVPDMKTDAPSSNNISGSSLKEFAGIYINPGYGKIEITYANDSLYTFFSRKKLTIKPAPSGKNVFEATALAYPYRVSMPPFEFNKDKDGKIYSISIKFEPSINAIEFIRK